LEVIELSAAEGKEVNRALWHAIVKSCARRIAGNWSFQHTVSLFEVAIKMI